MKGTHPDSSRSDGPLSVLRYAARITLTVAAAAAGAWTFTQLNSPLPYMLGALCFTTLAGLAGMPVGLPSGAFWVVTPIIGAMLGVYFTPELVANARHWWGGVLAVASITVISFSLGPVLLRRVFGFDRTTAFFAASPGGSAEMIVLGHQFGADGRVIAVVQLTRIVTTITVVPFILRAAGALDSNLIQGAVAGTATGGLGDSAILIAAGWAGAALAAAIRLPAAVILGPMIVSSALHLFEVTNAAASPVLMGLSQLALGMLVGSRFKSLRGFRPLHAVFGGFCWTLCLLFAAACVALAARLIGRVDFLAYFLATSPGGLAEMTVITIASGIEVAFVATCHILRIVFVYISLPFFQRHLFPARRGEN